MSDSDSDQTQASSQSPDFTSRRNLAFGAKRRADATLKDQEAVKDYLTFKQSKGLMTESEKRLLDKIAAVCGMTGLAKAAEGAQQVDQARSKASS
jgi:hypothetical protein